LSVRRPRGIDDVTHVGKIEFAGVGAVEVHEVQLGDTAAIADEGDGLASFGIPGGRSVGTIGVERDALGTIAAGIGNIQRGISLHGG